MNNFILNYSYTFYFLKKELPRQKESLARQKRLGLGLGLTGIKT